MGRGGLGATRTPPSVPPPLHRRLGTPNPCHSLPCSGARMAALQRPFMWSVMILWPPLVSLEHPRSFLCSWLQIPWPGLESVIHRHSTPAAAPLTGEPALPALCSSENKPQCVLPEGTAPQTPPRMDWAQPGSQHSSHMLIPGDCPHLSLRAGLPSCRWCTLNSRFLLKAGKFYSETRKRFVLQGLGTISWDKTGNRWP